MKKLFVLAVVILVAAAAYILVGGLSRQPVAPAGKIRVTASFYPLGEFARAVGGDRAEVTVLVRPGTEPHDYDPSPQDIVALHRSDVLVYNGGGFEPWADKLAAGLRKDGVVVVSAGADVATGDPHVWLDPVLAAWEVKMIAAGMTAADPAGRATYETNAAAYNQKLADLDTAFRDGLAQCSRHEIVSSHDAFKYLADRYGFGAVGIAGLSPDEEPSPQKLAQITELVRAHDTKYIFFESLVSTKLAETLAQETGAQTLAFNPLEGLTDDEVAAGQDYLSVQRENLVNLKIALDCK
jgi:zinc transport system substrate-binding protein